MPDDVGVMHKDGKTSDVSRFLNRLLGMNLRRQVSYPTYALTHLLAKHLNVAIEICFSAYHDSVFHEIARE